MPKYYASPLTLLSFLIFILIQSELNLAIPHRLLDTCDPVGYLQGQSGDCDPDDGTPCCVDGQSYPQYQCSPLASGDTPAIMTVNNFSAGGDGGAPSECDSQFHSNDEMIVALSTGWYSGGSRCLKNIQITANENSVVAQVVDECDSMHGCDAEHAYQQPCRNNIVDTSQAVWDALGVSGGEIDITWSDA